MNSESTSFPPTRWTLIQKVRSGSETERAAALEDLCRAYWFPLYAFARKTGLAVPEAEDAVQTFILRILDIDLFGSAKQTAGHLRALLLTYFGRQLKSSLRHDGRFKRGGGATMVHLPLPDAEGRYQLEVAASDSPPDVIYHRQWAENLIQRALDRLRERFERHGKSERFDVLRTYMPWNGSDSSDMEGAAAADMSVGAFRTALHRFRQLYRQLILDEVRQTIDSNDPVLIENELRELLQTLST